MEIFPGRQSAEENSVQKIPRWGQVRSWLILKYYCPSRTDAYVSSFKFPHYPKN